jgi:hypothetical protein
LELYSAIISLAQLMLTSAPLIVQRGNNGGGGHAVMLPSSCGIGAYLVYGGLLKNYNDPAVAVVFLGHSSRCCPVSKCFHLLHCNCPPPALFTGRLISAAHCARIVLPRKGGLEPPFSTSGPPITQMLIAKCVTAMGVVQCYYAHGPDGQFVTGMPGRAL